MPTDTGYESSNVVQTLGFTTPTPTETPTATVTPNPTLIAALFAAATEVAKPPFQTTSFAVRAGTYYSFSFPLVQSGSTIEIQFTTTGGSNDVKFGIEGPTGAYVVDDGRVYGTQSVTYTVEQTGSYRLIFDNSYSIFTSKAVILRYRVYQ